MEDKVKEIIAGFIKIPPEQIGPSTAIGRTIVGSSILLHRMYAALASEGLVVDNYGNIKVFADLWPAGGGNNSNGSGHVSHVMPNAVYTTGPTNAGTVPTGVGVDIEAIDALPRARDFRTDPFYTMNFTAEETAYCILQPDPYASFAGLFAAKEALVKAAGQYGKKNFNSIEISHNPEGKPLHPGFDLSISHSAGVAVAVAITAAGPVYQPV